MHSDCMLAGRLGSQGCGHRRQRGGHCHGHRQRHRGGERGDTRADMPGQCSNATARRTPGCFSGNPVNSGSGRNITTPPQPLQDKRKQGVATPCRRWMLHRSLSMLGERSRHRPQRRQMEE
ncbi:protein of unknown function [Paraburkholderia kururiensis]